MEHLAERFQDARREEQIHIVDLGLHSWDILQKEVGKVKDMDHTKLIEKWKEDGKKEGRRDAEKEMKRTLREKEDACEDLETQKKLLEKKLLRSQQEKEKELEDLERRLKKEIDREKEVLIRETRLEAQADLQQKIGEYQVQLVQMKAKEDWHKAYENAQKDLELARTQLADFTKVKTAFTKGQEGEEEVESLLEKMEEWDSKRVSKEKHRADFRITSKDNRTFILDSKNYTSPIDRKERDKLISDVDNDAHVAGGILVSLTSKIFTKNHFDIEITPEKKPIMYLVLESMTNEAKLVCISAALKFLLQYVASHDEREKNELIDRMQKTSERLKDILNDNNNNLKKAKELYESLKLGIPKIQGIIDYMLFKKTEEVPATETAKPRRRGPGKKSEVSSHHGSENPLTL
jgi:hypothetical protein